MDDETLLKTMKNGLMIAGHEMGSVGDHWPAINTISKGLDQEFHELRCNEAVIGELEFHYAEAFRQLEEMAEEMKDPTEKAAIKSLAKELWERYYAVLEPVSPAHEPEPEDVESDFEVPNMKAAVRILKNLGGRTWQ